MKSAAWNNEENTEKKQKFVSLSVEESLKREIELLDITVYWVKLRSASDKIRFLVHIYNDKD